MNIGTNEEGKEERERGSEGERVSEIQNVLEKVSIYGWRECRGGGEEERSKGEGRNGNEGERDGKGENQNEGARGGGRG